MSTPLSLVTTFTQIKPGARFRFDHRGCTYVKLDNDRYQLIGADGREVPGMTYRRFDGARNYPVFLTAKAA